MGGVDRADQMRMCFGGFAGHGHFKKWYKKIVMGVLDCMLINARLMWNMSVDSEIGRSQKRKNLERHELMHVLAHELLTYETPSLLSPKEPSAHPMGESVVESVLGGMQEDGDGGSSACRTIAFPRMNWKTTAGKGCVVCQPEVSLVSKSFQIYNTKKNRKAANEKESLAMKAEELAMICEVRKGSCREISLCCPISEDGTGVAAHGCLLHEEDKELIHSLFPEGLTCMQILHSDVGRDLWKRKPKGKGSAHVSCTVARSHEYIDELRKLMNAKVAESIEK
jgi:hypothetical protein